jgi:hypothetical protein
VCLPLLYPKVIFVTARLYAGTVWEGLEVATRRGVLSLIVILLVLSLELVYVRTTITTPVRIADDHAALAQQQVGKQ